MCVVVSDEKYLAVSGFRLTFDLNTRNTFYVQTQPLYTAWILWYLSIFEKTLPGIRTEYAFVQCCATRDIECWWCWSMLRIKISFAFLLLERLFDYYWWHFVSFVSIIICSAKIFAVFGVSNLTWSSNARRVHSISCRISSVILCTIRMAVRHKEHVLRYFRLLTLHPTAQD